jgi:hypothetical protein
MSTHALIKWDSIDDIQIIVDVNDIKNKRGTHKVERNKYSVFHKGPCYKAVLMYQGNIQLNDYKLILQKNFLRS